MVTRCTAAALCVGGVGARMQAAAVLCAVACGVACVLGAGEEEDGKRRVNAEGKTGALSLLFMGDLGRSWARNFLRTIP